MAKRVYQVGEKCDVCGTPTIQGIKGAYCKPCYIEWKNKQESMPPSNNGKAPYRPTKEAMGQRREFQNTMDYKAEQISNAQKAKEDSMRIYASGRDAVLIVTTFYPEISSDMNLAKEEEIKEKIEYWQNYLTNKIYCDKPF